jgi:thiamine biosynthesis lipoprotein
MEHHDGASLTAADIDATAAFALGPDAVRWLRSRGHTALVVDADGATTRVEAPPAPPR